MNRFNFFRFAFYSAILVIEFLATTTVEIKPIENSWDKANHFIAFFYLYVALYFAYPRLGNIGIITILLLFAIQIEIVQYFIPGRYFSLLDIVADGVGIVLGMIIVRVLLKIRLTSHLFKI
ncbi:MAG: VanZ family protein [Campylobacterota bacterium]|nr:VanZ family protein [Campylobacterota bacterium]